MAIQEFTVIRKPVVTVPGKENFTPGVLYRAGIKFSESCEDEDRHLENVGLGAKIYGRTAIPRGRYRVVNSYSPHFKRDMPHLVDVPGFDCIMLHGANRAEDLLGCIGIGQVRTADGIAQCAVTVQRLFDLIEQAKKAGIETWLEVK